MHFGMSCNRLSAPLLFYLFLAAALFNIRTFNMELHLFRTFNLYGSLAFWLHHPNILELLQPTGRIWQALILPHSYFPCYLSTVFLYNTTYHLMFAFTYLWEEGINITTYSFTGQYFNCPWSYAELALLHLRSLHLSLTDWLTDWDTLKERLVWYPLETSSILQVDELHMNLSQIDPSLAVAFSILFNLSSVPVLAITALSQSKPLTTEMGGTLTIPNEEATSTILVVLPLETVVDKESEVELFIGRNETYILHNFTWWVFSKYSMCFFLYCWRGQPDELHLVGRNGSKRVCWISEFPIYTKRTWNKIEKNQYFWHVRVRIRG